MLGKGEALHTGDTGSLREETQSTLLHGRVWTCAPRLNRAKGKVNDVSSDEHTLPISVLSWAREMAQ